MIVAFAAAALATASANTVAPASPAGPDTAPTAIAAAQPEPAPAVASPSEPAPAAASPSLPPEAPGPASPDAPAAPPAEPAKGGDAAPAAGDIVVTARQSSPADPMAKFNAQTYAVIQSVDNAVIGPVAHGYEHGIPRPVRDGLRNFLRNLEEPISFVNYVLQLKPGRAVRSLGRFAVNSTIGVAGLVDVAKKKPFYLPYRPNGFANTFACYGIGPGPYFFLPLVGPITLRDLVGLGMDKAAVPFAVGKPFKSPYYAIPFGVIDSLNDRIEIDGQLQRLREESPDPYVATRELYLKQRKAEIAAICPRKGDPAPDKTLPPRVGKGVD